MTDDDHRQSAEIDALRAMYGDSNIESTLNVLRVSFDDSRRYATFHLPSTYPSLDPPEVVDAPRGVDIRALFTPGYEVLLEYVERLRNEAKQNETDETVAAKLVFREVRVVRPIVQVAGIVTGEMFTLLKSRFVGHAVRCETVATAKSALVVIREDRRNATHNMWAYRVVENGISKADNDDDGEQFAGGRLAELLHATQKHNVLVVVTRYFGGTMLGPQRFKLINQAARDALDKL